MRENHLRRVFTVLAVLLIALTLSAKPAISGQFTVTSKYGNMDTNIKTEDFEKLGYEKGDVFIIRVGNVEYEAPYVRSYGDVEPGNRLFHDHHGVLEFAICNNNYANTYGFKEGDTVSIELKEKAGYLETFLIRDIHKSEKREDYISDTVFANVRPIVLGEIGFNKLYRSCNPILDDARGPYANRMLSKAGIKTVLNLADNQRDLLAKANKIDPNSWYTKAIKSGNVIGLDMGISFFDQDFIAKLHDALVFMAEHNPPYLVHCNEGRDRAGYVSALLEALMGASTSEIYNDYMASFDNYFGIKEGTAQYEAYRKIQVNQLKTVNGGVEITDQTASAAVERYFIETVGLTQDQVDTIKAKLR